MLLTESKNSSSKITSGGSNYYFSRLSDDQKMIYKSMFSGIRTFAKEIKMPIRPINEMSMIFNYVLLDNPIIFYVSSFSQSSDLYTKKCSILPGYKYAQNITEKNVDAITKYLQVFNALKNKSDIEKEIFVHDYCLNNFGYDYTLADYSYSVLGPVFNKAAVCEGIARFVKLSFDYLGVKSLVVSGKAKNPTQNSAMEGHAWNIVKINGKTYHLDVTFDMTIKNKMNRYDYFNIADGDIKKDHLIINDVPPCTTIGNDYFSVNSLLVNSIDELDTFIEKVIKKGKKNILVKIMNLQYSEAVINKIMGIAQQQYSVLHKGGVMVEIGYNSSQMVFEINFK